MTDETGVEEGVADPQVPATEEQGNQQINWQAAQSTMAEQKKAIEELRRDRDTRDQQLAVYQNYMNQQQQAPQESARSPLDDINEDDVMTGADFKRTMSSMLTQKEREMQNALQAQERKISLMAMRSQHSDYDEAVRNAVELAETNPELSAAISSSSNPQLLAYQLGKMHTQQPQASQVAAAQRMVENSQKPGSASQATTGSSALNAMDQVWNMPQDEFEKRIAMVKAKG